MRLTHSSVLAFGLANLGTVAAQAQFLINELSFGYTGKINDHGEASVPGFSIQGTPNLPEVLSNRVILTPPAPGNSRGAVWADKPNQYREWVADVDFRANGPERGGGNLNIWLAKRGDADVASSSIYTVNRFDGLALVIDQHSSSGGMIRGFLNDGTIDYRTHHSVDSLAFAHCNYAYRNLGRPSRLKLRQTAQTFKVEIDDRLCFESDQITIPTGYQFGITAASADNPDSFELFKMVVMTEDLAAKSDGQQTSYQAQDQSQSQSQSQNQNKNQAKAQTSYGRSYQNSNSNSNSRSSNQNAGSSDSVFDDDVPDAAPDSITSSKAQFADLHNRIQSINHHLSTIFRQVANTGTMAEKRHEETSQLISELKQALSRLDRLETITNEIIGVRRELQAARNDINHKVSQTETNLKRAISSNHGSMLEHVAVQATQAAPGHGRLIFVIIGSQFILVAGYIYYERKKTLPKKYL